MNIFLTGGGDQEEFKNLDKKFLDCLKPNSHLGLLAQAADNENDALDRVEYYFKGPKVKTIDLIRDSKTDLSQYDALLIEGGNTFNLINAIRGNQFFSGIQKFAKSGKPIYADSAGAIVLGSDLHTAFLGDDADEDTLKLQDYRGLDIISPWCVHAHATSDEFEALEELLYQIHAPILALAEETGVHISNSEIRVYGKSELWILDYEGRRSILPNETYNW